MRLYIKSCLMHVKSKMQYPISFIFTVFTSAVMPFGFLFSISMLFMRFKSLAGFDYYEVVFMFAVIYFGLAAGETFFRGLDMFSRQIRNAGFDRILARPHRPVLQALCQEFEIYRAGRIIVSIGVLISALKRLNIEITAGSACIIVLMLAGGVAVYFGILLLGAAFCFVTVEGIEVINILINGGQNTVQYPISIYGKAFRLFFTFIVPMAATNFYPAMYLLGKEGYTSLIYALSPLLAFIFIIPCALLWSLGVRRYNSTGS